MSRPITQLAPNPRLQRTRSAPLRSPLSRKSFGDKLATYCCHLMIAMSASGFMLAQGIIGGVPSTPLREQLAKADIVAFAKIVAGDADTLPGIFRCRVTEALKGAKLGDVICLQTGDYKLELGTEYLLVLERRPEKVALPLSEAVSQVCDVAQRRSIFQTNGTTRPLPVRYTYQVRSLCPDQTCPFGVEAIDVWSSGLGPLPDFVEGFQIGNGSPRETQFWIRKIQLIHALRWQLAAL